MKRSTRTAFPAAAIAVSLLAALVYLLRNTGRQPLVECTLWALVLLAAFIGWGSLVAFVVSKDEPVDLGLRAVWGASAIALVGGILMVPSAMTRTSMLAIIDVGVALAVASLARERARVARALLYGARVVRRDRQLAVVWALVAFLVVFHFLGGVTEWHTNPYDDDIAYLAFAKKLSDTGAFPEPFSFRRLSAMGGQTLFEAMTLIRCGVRQAHTFDRGICVLMIVMLLTGHRERGRRPALLVLAITIVMFLTLPLGAINTASYFSGVVFFLGLYRTLVWLGDEARTPWKAALPLALVSAAACTLRQNFLPVPAFVLAVSYLSRLLSRRGEPIRPLLIEPVLVGVFTIAAVLPWMIAQWQSNATFLYPFMLGTFNPALQLKAAGMTFVREIQFQVWVALEGMPLKTMGLFVIATAFVRERATRRPLWSLLAGCAGGGVMLVHGLTQSDAGNIGRYAVGFMLAFVLATALAVGMTRLARPLGRLHVAAGLAVFAMLAQLVDNRTLLNRDFYQHWFPNIDELAAQPPRIPAMEPPEVALYARLQGSVPRGERIAVLLDEPYLLSFDRNPIWNLDMPGYASLPPRMPFFKGSEALEAYFRQIGVRYFAFVKPDHSRYHYRREYWVEMVANEQEIWRAFSPYLLDFLDNEVAIASRHKHLFEERGMVVVDLEEPP